MIFVADDELFHNIRNALGYPKKPGFKQYFSEDLFLKIKEDIGLPDSTYRIISLGISPSVAQFNGFYTLDGLFSVYHYGYKLRFREIMSEELEKNPSNRKYFDNWGNRCYYFHSEKNHEAKSYLIGKNSKEKPYKNLNINLNAFKNLGGRFIFSALPIENIPKDLVLKGIYETPDSYWKVYVYEYANNYEN